jgi:LDH2 family malate/lactate/ureidoglycolate dehydrogenase
MDPNCFGGLADFKRQTEHVAKTCRETPARAGFERVRLPGESGIRRRREQLEHGVELHPAIMPALKPWSEKFGVEI